jgi:hypothetical protein
VRWNSPYINHFTQPDTIIPDQTNPQSWDRYSYVNNNPLRYTDPTGHYACGDGEEHDCNGHKQDPNKNPHPPKPTKPPKDKNGNLHGSDKDAEDEKLWPDNWFSVECAYTSSCVGQYVKYYTFSFGTTIPNPITGTVVGWHASISLDQYGDWFLGGGLDAGKNILGVSASLVEGRFAGDQLPENDGDERKFLNSYLTGNSFQGFLVPIVYIGGNYSPSTRTASLEDGIGIPQGGVAWTYTIPINGGQP